MTDLHIAQPVRIFVKVLQHRQRLTMMDGTTPEEVIPTRKIANTTSQLLAARFQATRSCSIHEFCDASCAENAADVTCTPLLSLPYEPVNVEVKSPPPRARDEPLPPSDASTQFSYNSLVAETREFRLVCVKRSIFRADYADCELLTFSLDSPPPYTALSYCWGTDPPNRSIVCNGSIFAAPPSLEGALKRFRSLDHDSDEVPYPWIDAICIDQTNTTEKSQQLMMMQDIYRKADTVMWTWEMSLRPGIQATTS